MTAPHEQPSVVDALADDTNPPEMPEGAPELVPYLQIRPRSRRAEFKRKYAQFAGAEKNLNALRDRLGLKPDQEGVLDEDVDPEERLKAWADMDDYIQLMDELMEFAAVDPPAYRKWADEADDETLMGVFTVYCARSQPGEASSSTS